MKQRYILYVACAVVVLMAVVATGTALNGKIAISPTFTAVAGPTEGGSAKAGPTQSGLSKAGPTQAGSATSIPYRVFLPFVQSGYNGAVAQAVPSPSSTATPAATSVPTPAPPPPTPTPRIKPPPSIYKRLQDYPRPAGDSGYGFHINASAYPPTHDTMVYQVIPTLQALGATWVTVWVADENQADRIKPLIDNGFEVVLRLNPINQKPHPNFVPRKEQIAKYVAAGVHYFVTGNEPNLGNENAGGSPGDIGRQFMMASDVIKAAGGIPMVYPMSPGGNPNSRVMLEGMLQWLKDNDALDALDGAAVAVHNRPHNKPLEVRDDTSFVEYEWVDDTIVKYLGRSLPIIGTEAGYTVGETTDRNFPRTTPESHAAGNMAIITGFRDGRWRDSLFAEDFWILGEFGYRADAFIGDPWVFNALNKGKDLPIVEQLKALPKFVRKFQGGGFETKPR